MNGMENIGIPVFFFFFSINERIFTEMSGVELLVLLNILLEYLQC